jgi:glycosyltransferase involved in cell wall biosynthesis
MIVAIDTNCILPGRVGGIENYTLGLIEALKLPGSPAERLILLTRPENHELFRAFTDHRTSVHLLERPKHNGQPVQNWAALLANDPVNGHCTLEAHQLEKAKALRKYRVDLIHFPGNTINPLDLDIAIVLNLHDLQHRHFPQYFASEEIANREQWWIPSARRADALIAASDYIRNDLHAQLHLDLEKIFVTPDPFQSAFFSRPSQTELDTLQAKLNLPETFFIYPAACWPHKNHGRLIRAFARADIKGSQLVLTGGGQENSSLPALIAELHLQDSVRLLGRVSTADLIGLYHLATSMIFPSQHESWSIPIMEAMACGCPCASSNVTSLPEEIGDAGLLFAPDDIDAMSAAMRRLASDASLRRTFSERGRQRVQQFGPTQFVQTLTQAYQHACRAYKMRKAA